jgi:hypothetical protein
MERVAESVVTLTATKFDVARAAGLPRRESSRHLWVRSENIKHKSATRCLRVLSQIR